MKSSFITMYLPIFREKLAKLERRGQGLTAEAARLRKAISQVETAAPSPAAGPELTEAA